MFKEITIWVSLNSNSVAVYRCFESLETQQFAVQSKDIFNLPLSQSQLTESKAQQIELYVEEPITTRALFYSSITEAITEFDKSFNDFD